MSEKLPAPQKPPSETKPAQPIPGKGLVSRQVEKTLGNPSTAAGSVSTGPIPGAGSLRRNRK